MKHNDEVDLAIPYGLNVVESIKCLHVYSCKKKWIYSDTFKQFTLQS